MLHHISVAVDNPLHVAKVLSEVWNGKFFPFPPHPGSYIVLAGDQHGTAIELYPAATELIPGESEVEFSQTSFPRHFTGIHAAISVPISQKKIEEIGGREGWIVLLCNRGPFQVVEFWVENKLMLEFLPPALTPQYLTFMQPQNFEQLFATSAVATSS
ncbi:hypothetical protein [Chroococcidiopsis sp. CCMEE 29]|uniref:hypothetical protein n=1 Tax=Chroococcidiopsis sp. CCMEE 29 TaxID=155894 RepID=UPI00202141F8|nr:hypothetical protein [Chroococcidiopsis sp. CCMEE 29]